jgi:uncharacterized protein YkwD
MRNWSALWFALMCFGALAPAGEKNKKFQHTADETKIFELTNQERKKKDVPALKLNPALSKIARAHSENMARQGKMEHKLDGKDFDDRVRDGGYRFSAIAENIGNGKGATLEMIMKAWMDSEDHRTNILNNEYTEIGVGAARDKGGRLYLTQVFGHPR